MESDPRRLGRRELWLWFSAVAVTMLSAIAFLLSSIPSLFLHKDHFYEIRSDQSERGILVLLLLFNAWLVYRQWFFRRLRRQATGQGGDLEEDTQEFYEFGESDPVTGLGTPASVTQQLGREIARARQQNTPLCCIALHLDDFGQIHERFGRAGADVVLKEFVWRLKKASRGCDFAVRLPGEDILLVLPECSSGGGKFILDRLGPVEFTCSGENIPLTYSAGWIDHRPGETPEEMLKRACQLLQLYKKAGKDSVSTSLSTG